MNKPLRMERLAFKTIGLETIILDTKIGKEVHQLNEVASFVWNLCDGNHDLRMIIDQVCNEFEVESEDAARDVEILLGEFSAKSLLADSSL